MSMGVRLFPAVHGCIADSVRDHEPGPVAHLGADYSGRGSGSGRFTEPLDPGFRCLPSSVKSRQALGRSLVGSRFRPMLGLRDSRALTTTLLLSGYRFGLPTPGGSPRLPGLHKGCRMQ